MIFMSWPVISVVKDKTWVYEFNSDISFKLQDYMIEIEIQLDRNTKRIVNVLLTRGEDAPMPKVGERIGGGLNYSAPNTPVFTERHGSQISEEIFWFEIEKISEGMKNSENKEYTEYSFTIKNDSKEYFLYIPTFSISKYKSVMDDNEGVQANETGLKRLNSKPGKPLQPGDMVSGELRVQGRTVFINFLSPFMNETPFVYQ